MKHIIIILSTLLCSPILAQKTVESLKLKNHEEIIAQSRLPSKGFILVTGLGIRVGGKHDVDVRYFNENGNQVWSKTVSGKFIYVYTKANLVVSPNGEHIYLILMHNSGYFDKKHYISHFNLNGDESKFELEGREEFGKNLQTIFCDNSFLYYLATDNGNEMSNRKKNAEKLILNRFDHKGLAYKRFILDLPTIEGGENSIFWSLIGQNTNEKFLASKNINKSEGLNRFTVAPFDSTGKIGKVLSLETSLDDNRFTRPSKTEVENYWGCQNVNLDRVWKESPGTGTSPGVSRLVPTDGAFGHIAYSDLHDSFYVYGLFGPKPFRNVGPVYEGFYVHKFDRSGVLSWKKQEMATSDLMNIGAFRVHATPMERGLQLIPVQNDNLIATINIRESTFPFLLDPSGPSKIQPKYEGHNWKAYYLNESTTRSLSYISKSDVGNKVSFLSYVYPSRELLVKFDSKKSILDVILFEK